MSRIFFVGTYTEPIRFGTGELYIGQGKGIYTCALAPDGGLSLLHCRTGVQNPSYLCLTRDHRFLYCVNELKDSTGRGGRVSAFQAAKDGSLHFLNRVHAGGADPCHIALSPTEDALYVSNFMSGSVSVFAREADGSLSGEKQLIQHQGSSVIPGRQDGPHAHSLTFDPAGAYAFVPDLGVDKVFIYRREGGVCLQSAPVPPLKTVPGSGPRHLTFNRAGDRCYLINELASSISVFRAEGATLSLMQTVSTLPDDFHGNNICADVHLSNDETLLFGSNRGHDSIITFKVQPDGTLQRLGWIGSGGETPRNFTVDPSGEFLVVCNQTSNLLCSFRIDPCGLAHKPVSMLEIGSPVCVKFMP